jgi:hypothetical protein
MHAMRKMLPPMFWLIFGLVLTRAAGSETLPDGAQFAGGAALSASAVIGSLSLTGSRTISLPQRDRSGRAIDGEQPVTASLAVLGDQMYLSLRVPRRESGSPAPVSGKHWARAPQRRGMPKAPRLR